MSYGALEYTQVYGRQWEPDGLAGTERWEKPKMPLNHTGNKGYSIHCLQSQTIWIKGIKLTPDLGTDLDLGGGSGIPGPVTGVEWQQDEQGLYVHSPLLPPCSQQPCPTGSRTPNSVVGPAALAPPRFLVAHWTAGGPEGKVLWVVCLTSQV